MNSVSATTRIGRGLRVAIGWPAFYFVVILLGLVELGWLVPAIVFRMAAREPHGSRFGRAVISFVFRHYFRLTRLCGVLEVDASELDTIDPNEPLIIAPNHPTGLDALIIISRLPTLNCIMKASMLDNLLLGSGARLAAYIRNDGPTRMFRLSTEDLRRGGQLIIFPEATRTLAAPVNPFKGGFVAIARVANVPIQTVIVETNTPYLSKGWSVLKKPPVLPMRFKVRLGRRFDVQTTGDLTPFVEQMREYFVETLDGVPLGDLWDRTPPSSDVPRPRDALPDGRRMESPGAVPSGVSSLTTSHF